MHHDRGGYGYAPNVGGKKRLPGAGVKPLSYGDYLRVLEIFCDSKLVPPDDEMLSISIVQRARGIWFKRVLHG